jgi:3-phosphoshikimate 1-carboxyvinyltransferase
MPGHRKDVTQGPPMSVIDLPSLALILGALARGCTRIVAKEDGALDGLVVALGALGASVTKPASGEWLVQGTGLGGWREPDAVLDLGAKVGAVPLMAGLLATHDFTSVLVGDSVSLIGLRGALERVGARFALRRLDRLPGAVTGTAWPLPARHEGLTPVDAAALLLAGLNSPGRTGVVADPELDQAIGLMRAFGAAVDRAEDMIWVTGYPDITGTDVRLDT